MKGLWTVCFITVLICRAAGKALLPAHSRPCHFRHEFLANIPSKWQPWHPEPLRVRGGTRTGAGADRPCLDDPEGPGGAGKEPSPQLLTEPFTACFASCTGCRSPQPLLGWRASATVCPAAATAPVPSPALRRGQQPRETAGLGPGWDQDGTRMGIQMGTGMGPGCLSRHTGFPSSKARSRQGR